MTARKTLHVMVRSDDDDAIERFVSEGGRVESSSGVLRQPRGRGLKQFKGVPMEPSSALWGFARHLNTRGGSRGPLVIDALRALQSWRKGHGGRTFRFVRPSPLSPADRLSARLLHLNDDEQADVELARWCSANKVKASVLPAAPAEQVDEVWGLPPNL